MDEWVMGVADIVELWSQSEHDGAKPYTCVGSAKVELIRLERQIHDHDAAQHGTDMSDFARELLIAPLPVLMALAGRGER
jgi:hypothetical protein